MSLTLDHGPRPLNTSHMYPLFRPSPRILARLSPQPDAPVPSPENAVHLTPSGRADDLSQSISGSATHDGANCDNGSSEHAGDHQQTNSATDAVPACASDQVSSPGRGGTSTQGPTEERGENSIQNEPDRAQSSLPVNTDDSPPSESLSPRPSSVCNSTNLPPSHSGKLTINLPPSKTRSAPESSESQSGSAPTRKMMCLSSDGKLATSSPAGKGGSNAKRRPESNQNLRLKNGRLVPSRRIVLRYSPDGTTGGLSIGERIDSILSCSRDTGQASDQNKNPSYHSASNPQPIKATHPFFSRKAHLSGHTDTESKDGESATDKGSDCESTTGTQTPKPWAAIKFSSSRFNSSKDISTLPAIWPPLSSQYHGDPLEQNPVSLSTDFAARATKQKHEKISIPSSEDILYRYRDTLSQASLQSSPIAVPRAESLMPEDLLRVVQSQQIDRYQWSVTHSSLQSRKRQLLRARSSFDRGLPAGPHDWTQKYAPTKTEEVLQPSVGELTTWLAKMKVHNVQSGLPIAEDRPRKVRRKAQAKKRQDDLDDFIVSSDESVPEGDSPKNAILICGPHGCGKTASVYAAASELDFEVFELHPGMRRSSKDIFDRVGDMTANHLVQASAPRPRPRTTADAETEGSEMSREESTERMQQNMTSFVKGAKKRKSQQAQGSPDSLLIKGREKSSSKQKQSVILLEEVDILFEDDRSFWSGVQALIQQSKRPIVMTCNSLESLPLEELPLHAILTFERPPIDDATEYLAHVAALEGHLIDRSALATLYQSRGRDLRGALMDLNFWCQMSVGSQVGGLDWIPIDCHSASATKQAQPRVVSRDTFHAGLNLIPERPSTSEVLLAFVQDQLNVPFLDLEAARKENASSGDGAALLDQLDKACAASDLRSCIDIADPHLSVLLATAAPDALHANDTNAHAEAVVSLVCDSASRPEPMSRKEVTLRLYPIIDELPTFPPAVGRMSTSVDGGGGAVITEVAPYVRSIIASDQQSQQRRFELGGGPQGAKQRTTRAARAAQEGGDKSNARRERWFPRELDYDAVLQTGVAFTHLGPNIVHELSPVGYLGH